METAAPPATGFAWEDETTVTVTVSNVGDIPSAHVVLLFGVPPPARETDIEETRCVLCSCSALRKTPER